MSRTALHGVHQDCGSTALSRGSPRIVRSIFVAISPARALSMPSVHPDTCGVMITCASLWKGSFAGSIISVAVGTAIPDLEGSTGEASGRESPIEGRRIDDF